MKHDAICPIVLGHDDQHRPIRLTLGEWCTGVHVLGAPGSGKSRFLQGIVRQIARQPFGGLVIDPHGELYHSILAYITNLRLHRPIYLLDFSGGSVVYGFNPFRMPKNGDVSTQVFRLRQAILKVWGQRNITDTPQLARWLKNTLVLLLERGDLTIADINALFYFQNKHLRRFLSYGTTVEADWQELNHFPPAAFEDKLGSTRNRLDVLASSTVMRRFLSLNDPAHTLDLERAMAERALILVNLQPSPLLDTENARLLGVLLLTQLYDAVRQRPVGNGRQVPPFFTVVDEVQTVPCPDLPALFAEARKFSAPLVVAHQYLQQLEAVDPDLLAAVHGAASTKIVFSLGSATDAAVMADEVFPGAINFTETKYEHQERRFRPVDVVREVRSTTRGESAGQARTLTQTSGETVTRGTSEERGSSYSQGTSTSRERSSTVSDSQSEGQATSVGHSKTRGKSHSEAETSSVSHSSGSSTGVSEMESFTTTRALSAVGSDAAGSSGSSFGSGRSRSDSEMSSESHARSSSITDSESETDSITHTASLSRTHALAVGTSEGESESESHTDSTSQSKSRSRARQRSKSVATGETTARSWGESVTQQPGVRHDEYIERTPDFFSLEEQRTRNAFRLRLQPQRHFTLRRASGQASPGVAPSIKDIRLPDDFVSSYSARVARKVGALSPEEVDQHVAERRLRLDVEARNFDQREQQALDLKSYDEQQPKRLSRKDPGTLPKPIRKKKPPSETPASE